MQVVQIVWLQIVRLKIANNVDRCSFGVTKVLHKNASKLPHLGASSVTAIKVKHRFTCPGGFSAHDLSRDGGRL